MENKNITCCAAVKTTNNTIIAADSLVSDGVAKYNLVNFSKIVEISPGFLVGFAGTITAYHLLKDFQKGRRKTPPKNSDECYQMFKPLFVAFARDLKDNCVSFDGKDPGLQFLVVSKNSIFTVSEYSAEEHETFAAIGSGSPWALGSLYKRHKTRKHLLDALAAACYYDIYTGGSIEIKEAR